MKKVLKVKEVLPPGGKSFGINGVDIFLNQGKMLRRPEWPPEHFIFRQVPSIIPAKVIPNMQSLPQDVKDWFQYTFESDEHQIDAIYYDNQIAYVGDSNSVKGWNPSAEDLFAKDWQVVELQEAQNSDF